MSPSSSPAARHGGRAAAGGRNQGAFGLSFGAALFLAPVLGSLVMQRFGSAALWTASLALGLAVAAGQLVLSRALAQARAASGHARETRSLDQERS